MGGTYDIICFLCGGGGPGVQTNGTHLRCEEERARRTSVGLCQKCSKTATHGIWCSECYDNSYAEYKGYSP